MIDNTIAETLIAEYHKELQRIEDYIKEQDAVVMDMRRAASKIRTTASEFCKHPEEREEDDYDYHNGISWTNYYCKCCNKYLRRV